MARGLTRRELGRAALGGAVGTWLASCSREREEPTAAFAPGEPLPWTNWAGNQACRPGARVAPRSEDELLRLLASGEGAVRPIGAGHSFSALVPSDGTLLATDFLHGLAEVDAERLQSEVRAGTRLHALGPLLRSVGQALPNQPDIDYQTLAGAVATSTHGTGPDFGSLSSYVVGLVLATPGGERIECDAGRRAEVFHAARCSLGALGVVARLRLQNVPAFDLVETSRAEPLEDVLAEIEQRRAASRHFEFHALPRTDFALTVTTEVAEASGAASDPEDPGAVYVLRDLYGVVGHVPWVGDWLYERILRTQADSFATRRAGRSYQVLAHPRIARFKEMEYTVPADAGPDCLREVLRTIRERELPIVFPIEYRYVARDDVWLSMFHERPGCTISVHQYADLDHRAYFDAVEPVFWKYEGRPHWGKLHSLDAARLAPLYPRWSDFQDVRRALDTDGRMRNAHIAAVLGA